jgi:biopolymer transport protein ExbB
VQGEGNVCCSIGHDGLWGPTAEVRSGRKGAQQTFRYDAGGGEPSFGAALRIDKKAPAEWTVVTQDLHKDFGDFTLTGLSFSVPPGQTAWIDHIYFARSPQDFSRIEARRKE